VSSTCAFLRNLLFAVVFFLAAGLLVSWFLDQTRKSQTSNHRVSYTTTKGFQADTTTKPGEIDEEEARGA
jgi:hypothetical protein